MGNTWTGGNNWWMQCLLLVITGILRKCFLSATDITLINFLTQCCDPSKQLYAERDQSSQSDADIIADKSAHYFPRVIHVFIMSNKSKQKEIRVHTVTSEALPLPICYVKYLNTVFWINFCHHLQLSTISLVSRKAAGSPMLHMPFIKLLIIFTPRALCS